MPIYNTGAPGVTTVGVSHIYANPTYSANRHADHGDVIDDHASRCSASPSAAPAFATRYSLDTTDTDLTGISFNAAGYGVRSSNPFAAAGLGTGRLRQGDNTYVFALGGPLFRRLLQRLLRQRRGHPQLHRRTR